MKIKTAVTALSIVIMMICDLIYSIGYYDYSSLLFEISMLCATVILYLQLDRSFWTKRQNLFLWGTAVILNLIIWLICKENIFLHDISLAIRQLNFILLEVMLIYLLLKNKKIGHWIIIVVATFLSLCSLSVCKVFWPIEFLIFVLALGVSKPCEEWVKSTIIGICLGVIGGFGVIQGAALIFRPFDTSRYKGMFYNCNVNALFYFTVYVCVLFLLIYSYVNKKSKVLIGIIICGVGILWPLVLLTQSRIAIGGFIVLTLMALAYLFAKRLSFKDFIVRLLECLYIILCVSLITLICVRYVPAIFHHPIWYLDEYSEERVHSFDKVNSDKYTNVLDCILGSAERASYSSTSDSARNDESHYSVDNEYIIYGEGGSVENVIHIAEPSTVDGEIVIEYKDGVKPGSDAEHPYIVREEYTTVTDKFLRIRKYIFAYFIGEISLVGNEFDNPAIYISANEVYSHSHNNYIWIGYCFGVPAMILFIGISVYVPIKSIIEIKNGNYLFWFTLFIFIGFDVIGVLEWCIHPNKFLWWLYFMSLIPFVTLKKRKIEGNVINEENN